MIQIKTMIMLDRPSLSTVLADMFNILAVSFVSVPFSLAHKMITLSSVKRKDAKWAFDSYHYDKDRAVRVQTRKINAFLLQLNARMSQRVCLDISGEKPRKGQDPANTESDLLLCGIHPICCHYICMCAEFRHTCSQDYHVWTRCVLLEASINYIV